MKKRWVNKKIKNILIKGVFGVKKQKAICYFGKKKEGFFFIHGLYSTALKFKYKKIASYLNRKGFFIFLFERSRLKKLNYEKPADLFIGKSFKDEVEDTKIGFKEFLRLSKLKKINIVGFSLGGTLGSFLINDFKKYIKNIFLFGSGVSTKDKNRPVVNSYPNKEIILKNFSSFEGKLILVQGSNDKTVPIAEGQKIILNKNNQSFISKLIIIKDVDHRFEFIKDKKEVNKLINFILNILSKEEDDDFI